MKLLYLALSFFALIVLDFYLKSNIGGIDGSSLNLPFLGLFVVLGVLLFLWRASIGGGGQSILMRRSTLFLLLFFAYFIFRIAVDISEIEKLKAYTFGTTGGIILFYIVGTLVAIVIGQHEKNAYKVKNYYKYFSLFFISYLMMSCYFLLSIFLEMSSMLRMDIFLVEENRVVQGNYQRPGDFLIISYLILITLYAQFISLRQTRWSLSWIRLTSVIVFTVFVIYSLASLLVAQMIGSNKAAVLIAGLALSVIMILMLLWSKSARNYLTVVPITFKFLIFSKLSLRLIFFTVLGIAILIGLILITVNYLDLDIFMTRLGGFGSGEIRSITSRLALLSNIIIHLEYSPFFGHMNVDCLTTGCGTYAHSVFASLLTHTGLPGLFLFAFYLRLVTKEVLKVNTFQDEIFIISNIYKLFTVLFFLAILVFGVIGTFFTWGVMWFAFGLILTAVKFKGSYEK